MALLILSLLWTGGIAWALVRAVRQYQRYEVLRPSPADAPTELPAVTVIVPARNESLNIGRCLAGIRGQDYPPDRVRVLVIDDHSQDDTADQVRRAAQEDRRVTLIQSRPLPAGCAGKPHACWQGAAEAGDAPWLCFMDTDTRAEPPLLRTAIAAAESRGADMLSLQPFQELGSWSERLVLPCGFFLMAFTQDVGRVNDPRYPDAAVNGQFILIRRSAYDAVGGHAAIRSELSEDSALASAVKSSGRRLLSLGSEGLIRTRMYHGFKPLWEGLSRQSGEILGTPAAILTATVAALMLGWVSIFLPAWCLALAVRVPNAINVAALIISTMGSLALLGTHIGSARYFKVPLIYGLLFPLGYTLGAAIAINGLVGRGRGRVLWKGRTYAPLQAAQASGGSPPLPQKAGQ